MSLNSNAKTSDSVTEILASIKKIIENSEVVELTDENKLVTPKEADKKVDNQQPKFEYLEDISNDFKKQIIETNIGNKQNQKAGDNILSVDDAMQDLASQIGIGASNPKKEKKNNDTILASIQNLEDFEQNEFDTVENNNNNNSFVFNTPIESLFLNIASEEINTRLRQVIAKWVQDNLPSLIKKTINEEISKALKNFRI